MPPRVQVHNLCRNVLPLPSRLCLGLPGNVIRPGFAHRERWPLSSLRRQGAWAVVDQVLSSGTNFVPALGFPRELGPAGFGAFSLAFLAWFGALSTFRSGLMQPYTLAAASLEGAEWRDITSQASGVVVFGGAILVASLASLE